MTSPRSSRPARLLVIALAVVAVVVVVSVYLIAEANREDVAAAEAALLAATADPPLRAVVADAVAGAESGAGLMRDELTGNPALEQAAAIARDGGDAVLTPTLSIDETDGVFVIVPTYDPPAPRTTDARRAQIAGYVVTAVDVAAAVEDLDGPVRVTDGGVPISGDVAVGGDERAVDRFTVLDREWRIEAFASEPFPAVAVVVIVVVLGLLLVAGIVLLRWQRQHNAGSEALMTAQHEGRVLTEMAAVLQASLDLSDVCPAFATLLFEHLPVDGVAIDVVRERGDVQTLFAIGATVDSGTVAVLEVPPDVGAGDTVALAMERERRLRGVLRMHVTDGFSESDQRIAVVAAQLAGASMDNAVAHARQHDALRRLSELDDLKTVFLGTAAHELRTPVTAITGFSSMLQDRGDDLTADQRKMMIGRLAENAARLRLLVEDLLDLSRLDSGRMVEATARLDFGHLVADVLADVGPILADREIDLVAQDGVQIEADRAALERVVSNLVSNAAKFSPPGSTIHIEVAATPGAGTCRFVVEDEGPGVPVSERSRIFSRFYRGKGEEVVRTRGTGIGLAVVLELVRMLGGSVAVDDGRIGARFVVELPLARPTSALTDESKEEPRVASS